MSYPPSHGSGHRPGYAGPPPASVPPMAHMPGSQPYVHEHAAPPPGQPYVPYTLTTGAPPRKRRRVFPWVFLAIQVLFVIWVVAGAASGGSIHSDAAAYCHAHPNQYISFSQCVSDYGGGAKVGAAIGVGLVVVLWAVVDIILGISYGIYRLARR